MNSRQPHRHGPKRLIQTDQACLKLVKRYAMFMDGFLSIPVSLLLSPKRHLAF